MKSVNGVFRCLSASPCETDELAFNGYKIMSSSLKFRILIVDDDIAVQKLICNILTALGFDVVAAHDGYEALQIFNIVDGFHLVLTDINMPRMDGWQLSLRLKQIKPRIPIIAITGEKPDGVLPRLSGSGINLALFKPLEINILKKSIENFLRF